LALQKQELLPGTDVFVLLQCVHAASPETFLYVPAAQGPQAPPSGPVVPIGHTQPVL
jgi:hypothetical protein